MKTHTPGPWNLRHDVGVSRVFTKVKIADVYSEAFGDVETQHANACLTAAAPDLLEALRGAREFIENQQLPDAEWERVLDLAVIAIAKAEGRQ